MAFEIDIERIRHIPEAPLRNLRHTFWWFRKTFFSKPKPPNPAAVVSMNKPEVVAFLGERFFEPGWEMSYSYRNEIVNLRRVQYIDDHPSGLQWWQIHIRGYWHPDGIELAAHFEPEPAEHPDEHIDGAWIDVSRGNAVLLGLLEEAGVEYWKIGDWPEESIEERTDDAAEARTFIEIETTETIEMEATNTEATETETKTMPEEPLGEDEEEAEEEAVEDAGWVLPTRDEEA